MPSSESAAFLGGVLAALVGAAVAAALTFLFTRRHAVRGERKVAYQKLLTFIEHIPTDIIFEVRTEEDFRALARRMVRSLRDSDIEMELIASRRVAKAADALLEELIRTDTAGLLSPGTLERLKREEGAADAVKSYRDAIRGARTELVQAMRKDLGVRSLPQSHFLNENGTSK